MTDMTDKMSLEFKKRLWADYLIFLRGCGVEPFVGYNMTQVPVHEGFFFETRRTGSLPDGPQTLMYHVREVRGRTYPGPAFSTDVYEIVCGDIVVDHLCHYRTEKAS